MRKQDLIFDHDRYRQLLAEAVDEKKRLALIQLLIEERAMDRLAAQRASERAVMTATNVSKFLGAQPRSHATEKIEQSRPPVSGSGVSPIRLRLV